ncbi:MAG TPA: hypothetical protein PLP05_12075 [Sedimentisphaerales bacterium]|nr:hypothetical protein [Sedimentisphaerales bacterium]
MATANENAHIIIKGSDNWQPVLLNIMHKAGIRADVMEHFTRRGQSTLWLFSKKSRPYKIIYHLGGSSALFCILARLRGKQIVSHWIGTDVMRYHGKMNPFKHLGVWVHQHLVGIQLADSEIIQDELRGIGIESNLLRLLPEAIIGHITPLPEQPVILSYWDDQRFDFYGGDIVMLLAKAFPEVKFVILRATGKGLENVPPNVQFSGLIDNVSEIYRSSTCLIRIPKHDGLSAMVLEAMANGRYVIYNKKCPFTSFANDFDSARKSLENILREQQPNIEGAEYVKKNFNIDSEANRLRKLMNETFSFIQ